MVASSVSTRERVKLNRKKISRDISAIILLLATITPGAFHTVKATSLTASFTHTPTQPARTENVTFTASASEVAPSFSFSWTFGDGFTATGSPVYHRYASSGVYTVNLTVTDSTQQQAFQVQRIIVTNYHPFSFGIASDIGNIGVGYSNTPTYAPRQSLLRLGNSTGLSFFIADGYLAGGFYYRNEAAWCGEFKAHYNNIVLAAGETDGGWTSVPYDDIIYDANNNSIYDNPGPDKVLFNGWGGVHQLAGPVNGSPIASDNKLRYWDSNGNGKWDPGESIVQDYNNVGKMLSYYPVMVGAIPPTGTPLSFDPKLKYFQRDNNPFYVRPQTNNDFEQYVSSCGFPTSLGAWHGSGDSCSNALPGQPGYTFPTCYGREYYFDYGYPTPELRIIVISPTVQNITGHMTTFGTDIWTYQKNDAHYNWVNQTIQAAYQAGIPGTMVVSFDQCLATTIEECGLGYRHRGTYGSAGTKLEADLFSLLLDNLGPPGTRLTYLVQGEEKGYSRFYPLATHPGAPFTSDGLGCAWDSATGNHGFPVTQYLYDTGDVFPDYNPACFANPQAAGQAYTLGPGFAGQGVSTIISASFGTALYNNLSPGEILVKDLNGTGKYAPGDPYIGSVQPISGTVLTGGQATNSHIGFIDTNHNDQWDPGETLFRDSDNTDGCTGTTTCNGKYDPGETVFSGPVPGTRQPAAFNDSDVKLIDIDGNGIWDKLNGSPHNVLETPYVATSMGANTPCNNNVNSTTCPGHGWVSFAFNPAGNQTNIDTNFCIDGETPAINPAGCISPLVYKDKYVVVPGPTLPTVTINNVSPNPTSTGTTVTVNFTINSATALSAITVDWGDGISTHPGLTATSDTHAYLTISRNRFRTFTISVTAANNAGQGSATVSETVNNRPPTLAITSVSPNPAKPGELVGLNFTVSDPDGTVGLTWVDWGDGSTPDLIFKLHSASMCQSMHPDLMSSQCTLPVGALLLFHVQDPSTIFAAPYPNGSIIIFRPPCCSAALNDPNYFVVHRVVGMGSPGVCGAQLCFITLGDANDALDPWDASGVPPSSIVGVYRYTLPSPAGTSDDRYDTHTYSSPGVPRSQIYTIRVNATDNNGMASFQNVTETVRDNPPPVPPAPPVPPNTFPLLFPTLLYVSVVAAIAVILTLEVAKILRRRRRLSAKTTLPD